MRIIPFLILFILVGFLYYPILSVYFSHDDFFHFKISQTNESISDFINLFGFHSFEERGIAFYRPLFREVPFNIFYSLFGLNQLPFRILSLAIHFVNIALVYVLMEKLFKKRELSFFTAFFFGINAANVGSLYYLAGGIQSLGATMFMLATLILFWEWLESRNIRFFISSFFTFLISLGSHELAVVTPLLLLGLSLVKGELFWKSVQRIVPFFVVVAVFLYFDFTRIGFSTSEQQYQFTFSPKAVFNSLAWYTAWALGIPEMFIDFVEPRLTLNPNLMKFWGDYTAGIFFFGGIAATIAGASFVYALFRCGILKDRRFWFLLFWFPVALSPVILLPLHKSTYYLTPALAAFWGVVGFVIFKAFELVSEKNARVAGSLFGALIASIFMLSVTSVALADQTYPAANRGRIAQKLTGDVKNMYTQLPKGATVYFKNDPNYPTISGDWGGSSKQAAFVLNNEDALQLLYKDPTLKVLYEDLSNTNDDIVYSLVARLR